MKDLRVAYLDDKGIEAAFEKELDTLAEKYGMKRWASGEELESQKRDIAYE